MRARDATTTTTIGLCIIIALYSIHASLALDVSISV